MSAARHRAPVVLHCIARARERYGLDLDIDDLRKIVRRVQNNDGTMLSARLHEGLTSWDMRYKDTDIRVVISKDFWRVVTFVPRERKPSVSRAKHAIYRNGRVVGYARG